MCVCVFSDGYLWTGSESGNETWRLQLAGQEEGRGEWQTCWPWKSALQAPWTFGPGESHGVEGRHCGNGSESGSGCRPWGCENEISWGYGNGKGSDHGNGSENEMNSPNENDSWTSS